MTESINYLAEFFLTAAEHAIADQAHTTDEAHRCQLRQQQLQAVLRRFDLADDQVINAAAGLIDPGSGGQVRLAVTAAGAQHLRQSGAEVILWPIGTAPAS